MRSSSSSVSSSSSSLDGAVMFRPLGPGAAADLARFMRQATGGMDSDWPHLMIIGSPGYFAGLVKQYRDEQEKKCEVRAA
jgi:hypothetical protein